MELDGQGIERRDFPISRRGYEPAAVDAHLRAVASAVDELREQAQRGESLGASAASQVQGILEAAEATAASIVSGAEETARKAIASAEMDSRRTRQDAVSRAEAHVAAVAEAATALRGRVEGMDGELRAMTESLRGGAGRLSADLAAVEREMGALYDAAASRPPDQAVPAAPAASERAALAVEPVAAAQARAVAPAPAAPAPVEPPPAVAPSSGGADLDGARLVALNMALNGDSREATDRYLAENFNLTERAKLIDEVYAAIDG